MILFRGKAKDLPAFLENLIERYGGRTPVHLLEEKNATSQSNPQEWDN